MSATRDPAPIAADVDAEDVARMPAQGAREGPVVGAEDVNVLVEAAGDEESTGSFGLGVGFFVYMIRLAV